MERELVKELGVVLEREMRTMGRIQLEKEKEMEMERATGKG